MSGKKGKADKGGGDSGKPSSASNSGEEIARLTAELEKERQQRNYFQLERDKLYDFWQISQNQVTQLQSELLNKDREIEESEEKHLAEIKVYKQKVKHLLYEYQNNLTRIQTDAEKTLDHSQEENNQVVDGLKKQIRTLKLELKELELSHQEVIKNIKLKHDQDVIKLRSDFDLRCKELYAKYAYNTKALREDMELRRKNEIHELEERKNSQINALMKNHEKAFAEIKNYYNDITLNNLALINSLKEQVEGMKKKEERTERLMNEINAENKTLKKPLDDAKTETEELKRKLKNYEKDQMALKNTKSRLKVVEEKLKQTEWEKEITSQRFKQIEKERDDLRKEFVGQCKQIEQRVGLKNLILERKISTLKDNLFVAKDGSRSLDNSLPGQMDKASQSQVERLQKQLKDAVDAHNNLLKLLQDKGSNVSIAPLQLSSSLTTMPKGK